MAKSEDEENVPTLCLARWILAYVGILGFGCVYATRINLSMAIVCMVKDPDTNSSLTGNMTTSPRTDDTCGGNIDENSPDYEGELEWDKTVQGHLLSAFFYGYIVMQVPSGLLAGRYGGKHVFGVGMLITTIATLLSPVAARTHYMFLFALRVLIGVGTSVSFPSTNSMLGKWAPPLERSKLSTFTYAGTNLGNIITLALSGLLCSVNLDGGWPTIFYLFVTSTCWMWVNWTWKTAYPWWSAVIYGVLGGYGYMVSLHGGLSGLWLIAWYILVFNTPAEHPRISESEKKYIIDSIGNTVTTSSADKTPIPWLSILKSGPVWAILIAHTCNNWGGYTLLTNQPTYMKEVLKFDLAQNGFLSALPYILQLVFTILGGQLADLIRSRTKLTTTTVRKIFQIASFAGQGAFILAAGYVTCEQRYLAVVFMCLSVGFVSGSRSGYMVNHVDIAPRFAGLLFGITNTVATVPGIVGPYVVTALTPNGTREEWSRVWFICGGVFAFGALMYGLLASGELQPWASHEEHQVFDGLELTVTATDDKASKQRENEAYNH